MGQGGGGDKKLHPNCTVLRVCACCGRKHNRNRHGGLVCPMTIFYILYLWHPWPLSMSVSAHIYPLCPCMYLFEQTHVQLYLCHVCTFLILFESSNLGRDNLSRETGRTLPARPGDQRRFGREGPVSAPAGWRYMCMNLYSIVIYL